MNVNGHLVLSVLLSLAFVASTRAAGPDDPAPAPSFAPNESVLLNDQAAPSLDPALEAQPVSAGPRHDGLSRIHFTASGRSTKENAVPNTSADLVVCGKPIVRIGIAAAGQQLAGQRLRSCRLPSDACLPIAAMCARSSPRVWTDRRWPGLRVRASTVPAAEALRVTAAVTPRVPQ